MASVASQLIQEVTAHAQSDSLEDAREICADGTYFPNNLRIVNFHVPQNSDNLLVAEEILELSRIWHHIVMFCGVLR